MTAGCSPRDDRAFSAVILAILHAGRVAGRQNPTLLASWTPAVVQAGMHSSQSIAQRFDTEMAASAAEAEGVGTVQVETLTDLTPVAPRTVLPELICKTTWLDAVLRSST